VPIHTSNRLLLLALLWGLFLPSQAGETIKVGRWNNEKNHYVYSIAKLHTKTNKQETILVVADNIWGVVLPREASKLVVDRVDCFGEAPDFGGPSHNCMGWVSTRGQLRIRANVRYGWFDEYDGNENKKPILEVFVHNSSASTLPRMTGWTPGSIHEFTVKNENYVLAQLFNSQHLKQVRDKKKQFIEIDSDLLLDNVDFGDECGTRYQAKVVSAIPWTDSKVVAQSKGWEPHC
jgi:hypothetical protein